MLHSRVGGLLGMGEYIAHAQSALKAHLHTESYHTPPFGDKSSGTASGTNSPLKGTDSPLKGPKTYIYIYIYQYTRHSAIRVREVTFYEHF